MADEDDQFAKELAKALELSKQTAADDERRRKKYAELQGNLTEPSIRPRPNSALSKRSNNVTPPIPPQDSIDRKSATLSNEGSVRPRPRPSSSAKDRLSSQNATVKREGFIAEDLFAQNGPFQNSLGLTSDANPHLRRSRTPDPYTAPSTLPDLMHLDIFSSTSNSILQTSNHNGTRKPVNTFNEPYNSGLNAGINPPGTATKNPFLPKLASSSVNQLSASNPFQSGYKPAGNFLIDPSIDPFSSQNTRVTPEQPPKPDKTSPSDNLINLSPMDKGSISHHFKLHLDTLYNRDDNSVKSQASHSFGVPQVSSRSHIQATRLDFHPDKIAAELIMQGKVPPQLPPKQANVPQLQLKRICTPTRDLLLLDKKAYPQVQSVDVFDPLANAGDDARRSLDDQMAEFDEWIAARPKYEVAPEQEKSNETDENREDSDIGLQDPFNLEALSMAMVTKSNVKGQEYMQIVDELEAADESIQLVAPTTSTTSSEVVPTRPPKPKSMSVTKKPKKKLVASLATADEFTAFSIMVAKLKAEYRHDDSYTNIGLLFSKTIDLPKPESVAVDVTVTTEMAREPITATVDVNTPVEMLIWNVMSNISSNYSELSVDDYILKVLGRSEFLVNDTDLSDYAYVYDCLKLDEPIRFSLHELASLQKPFLREPGDDEEPIYIIKDELHGDKSYKVQTQDLNILYETFLKHSGKVIQQAVENGLGNLSITSLLQTVKAISSVLIGAETLELKNATMRLQSILNTAKKNIYDQNRFQEVMGDFQSAMDALTAGVKQIISMYCETFHVRFNPASDPKPLREVNEVTDSLENILIQVGSCHRLPAKFRSRFDQFKIIVSLFYAGRKVTEHVSTDVLSVSDNQDTLYFDQWLEMTDYPMCMVPVETRVMFTLCAMNTTQPPSGSGINIPHKWVTIGWVSHMLFDHKRCVVQGGKLLSLWQGAPDSTGSTGSNIWQPNTILVQANLPEFGYDLKFPSSLVTPEKRTIHTAEASLSESEKIEVSQILANPEISALNQDQRDFLWQNRFALSAEHADLLGPILQSAPHFSFSGIHLIQELLDCWPTLTAEDSLKLLLPEFPCLQIRAYAIKCLKNISSDEICDYLPQLVQALKFENYHDSPLARLLLDRSITSVRFSQQLYWYVKEAANAPTHRERYKLIYGGLVSVMGRKLREEVENEEKLVQACNLIADEVKRANPEKRDKVMSQCLTKLFDLLQQGSVRLPTDPGLEVEQIESSVCTYFNSFTVPLKLVFKNPDRKGANHTLMYKVGDDLNQDMLVMQLLRVMDNVWLHNDLDMKLVTFTCLPTGEKRGMVEIINDCETLRKIQTMSGITGSFKDQPLANWLQKHNATTIGYARAVENFALSCAGYCVATYILGIGDRHNDNIMVKRSGHLFHIDFSKFLGDSQMFGNFKRDRTPFILTPDMAYVINGGDKPSQKFQEFVDICCEAFNAIRENSSIIINLLTMMSSSGIKGVTKEAIKYVNNALLPDRTRTEATASFTRMIEESLQSKFVQLNFFIHNLAQLKFSSHSDGGLLSFVPTTYKLGTDGRIANIEIFDYQKRYVPEKHYIYIIKVYREGKHEATFVYRRYSEFQELYGKLVNMFPLAPIPRLPGSILFGRTHVQKVAERRKLELENFLRKLLQQSPEISDHDIIYTFFHPMLRDERDVHTPEGAFNSKLSMESSVASPSVGNRAVTGEVKLSLVYKHHALRIMIMHVKGLCGEKSDVPNPYVKMYLLPDPIKTSKRKTKIVKSSYNPTYNAMFEYRMNLAELKQRTLQVSVWSAEMTGNDFLGSVPLKLSDLDLYQEKVDWYKLCSHHIIL